MRYLNAESALIMNRILKDWNNCTSNKIFDFRVLDKRTNSTEWITFDISTVDNMFVAQHEALSQAQIDSDKIASTSIEINPDFSLDENLQELHSACADAINDSDFYMEWDEWNEEKFEIYLLPDYFAGYLINADCSSLREDEVKEINDFIKDQKLGLCTGILHPESNFYAFNALNNLGGNCLHFIFERGK